MRPQLWRKPSSPTRAPQVALHTQLKQYRTQCRSLLVIALALITIAFPSLVTAVETNTEQYGGVHQSFYPIALPLADSNVSSSQVDWRRFSSIRGGNRDFGNAMLSRNPRGHISVTPPPTGCGTRVDPVLTSRSRLCVAATNGGFFKTDTGACINAVVSEGRTVQPATFRNVHFGVTDNGFFFMGYLDEFASRLPSSPWSSNPRDISASIAEQAQRTARERALLPELAKAQAEAAAGREGEDARAARAARAEMLAAELAQAQALIAQHESRRNAHNDDNEAATESEADQRAIERAITVIETVLAEQSRAEALSNSEKGEREQRRATGGATAALEPVPPLLTYAPLAAARAGESLTELPESALSRLSVTVRRGFPHAGLRGGELTRAMAEDRDWRFTQLVGGIVWLVREGQNVCETTHVRQQ